MEEITAYIRASALERTVKASEETKAAGMTITAVRLVGYGFDPNCFGTNKTISKAYRDINKSEEYLACRLPSKSKFEEEPEKDVTKPKEQKGPDI